MVGKLLVSRASACRFLLSLSSSQLITSTSELGSYFIKAVKSLSPPERSASSQMTAKYPQAAQVAAR
jgi:hypothetical protein